MTKFTKTRRAGEYVTEVVSVKSGRTLRIKVRKTEELNPSARGGAYKTVWVTSFGFSTKAYGDTRQEAFDRLIAKMAADGIEIQEA